jgi:hypothetical protein
MLGSIAVFAVMFGACALLAWELWLGFAKGYVHSTYVIRRIERAKSPIVFWANLVTYAVLLAVLGPLFVFAAIGWLTHLTPR